MTDVSELIERHIAQLKREAIRLCGDACTQTEQWDIADALQSLSDRVAVLEEELAETGASLERMTDAGKRALETMRTVGVVHPGDTHADDPLLIELAAALKEGK